MPFKSVKQEKWAHTKTGTAKLGKKNVDEFDQASKGMDLPTVAPAPKDPAPTPFNPVMKSHWGGRP